MLAAASSKMLAVYYEHMDEENNGHITLLTRGLLECLYLHGSTSETAPTEEAEATSKGPEITLSFSKDNSLLTVTSSTGAFAVVSSSSPAETTQADPSTVEAEAKTPSLDVLVQWLPDRVRQMLAMPMAELGTSMIHLVERAAYNTMGSQAFRYSPAFVLVAFRGK